MSTPKAEHTCPFCGAGPETSGAGINDTWRIWCSGCEDGCPVYLEAESGRALGFATEQEAIDSWDAAIDIAVCRIRKNFVEEQEKKHGKK